MKRAIVLGAGGFIGSHLVTRLKKDGYWVRGVDIKYPEFSTSNADDFVIGDLRKLEVVQEVIDDNIDEVYQLAADMGGAAYLFTGENDANVVHNSALINLHVVKRCVDAKVDRVFFSSSACIYPKYNQLDPNNPVCTESSAYPAQPDSEYGWEKLFSERLYQSFHRNFGLKARIARFHNIYGPEGVYVGGKEKAPAALCRKIAIAENGESIEVWGDGLQTRSFLYIDDCINGILALMASDCTEPLNIGSEEMISINDFARMIADISGKDIRINNIPGPEGVRGRCSENTLVKNTIDWQPEYTLKEGMDKTYHWILEQVSITASK